MNKEESFPKVSINCLITVFPIPLFTEFESFFSGLFFLYLILFSDFYYNT